MNFIDYRDGGRTNYVAFVEAIKLILEASLKRHSLLAHTVTGRAKELVSLKKKLEDRGIDPASDITEALKDLAGCRIVFLTNSQVDAYFHTGALHENFEILDVNVHHPVPGTDTESRLFDSTNYLVSLKPERVSLPEYSDFAGMRAEIQIQTLLNHAWAEMGHDTIYKEPSLKHLGQAKMTSIGERMNRVMQDHLIPAGHDFDKIARDFKRLLNADNVASETIEAIYHSDNLNNLNEALENYTELVLPHYDDQTAEFLKIFDALIDAVERSRTYEVQAVESEFGNWPGKTSLDIARRVAQIITPNRYIDCCRTFHALVRLFGGAISDDERDLWLAAGKELSGHNLAVWKKFGPAAQQVIIDELLTLPAVDSESARPLLTAMLKKILRSDVEGTTSDFDSITIHQGSVRISEQLRSLRKAAIDLLEVWLDETDTDSNRQLLLHAMNQASSAPTTGNFDEALALVIFEDTKRVEEIIISRAADWGLELRRHCEVEALRLHHHFHALRPDLGENADVVKAQQSLVGILMALRDQLNNDAEYVLYKTLIGYDTVRPEAWDGDPFDFNATDHWRCARFKEIISELDAKDIAEWSCKLERFVTAVGSDGGHLMPLRSFTEKLSTIRPDLGLQMLDEMNDVRSTFLSSILKGLEKAGRIDEAEHQIDDWLKSGQFLWALGNYLRFSETEDATRLNNYVTQAIKADDHFSVATAATIAAVWYERTPNQELVDIAFMPAIRYFTEKQVADWSNRFWFSGKSDLLTSLTESQSREFLGSFVNIEDVEYRSIQMLSAIARNFPQQVIDFFGTRLRRDRTEVVSRFDPIPFHGHDLSKVLASHADLLLPAIRDWYQEDPRFHQYRGGRLFKHVFPEMTAQVIEQLTELAQNGTEADLKFILKTLTSYEGDEQIYSVCMEVVERLALGDKLLPKVSLVLGETGVLRGEFGHVEAYAVRRDIISRWRDDPRPKVQAYVAERVRELEQSMAWEQRRAARDVAQRRRDWGAD
jgi:ppGpp synthetase/RelA/SpoT-type nucleotidyltranferase